MSNLILLTNDIQTDYPASKKMLRRRAATFEIIGEKVLPPIHVKAKNGDDLSLYEVAVDPKPDEDVVGPQAVVRTGDVFTQGWNFRDFTPSEIAANELAEEEKLAETLRGAVFRYMDSETSGRDHQTILELISYKSSTITALSNRATLAIKFRDDCLKKRNQVVKDVKDGTIPKPTVTEFIAMLPGWTG